MRSEAWVGPHQLMRAGGEMGESERFGAHQVVLQDPDLVQIALAGAISPQEVRAILERVVGWARGKPHLLVLVDLGRSPALGPETRRVGAKLGGELPRRRAIALYGGNFAVRVAVGMVVRAGELLRGSGPLVSYARDEEAARAWLAQARGVLEQRP